MDFSENLELTPKNEVQSAHYTKRQHSLHCTVVYLARDNYRFHYHLSDETAHNASFLEVVVGKLLEKYSNGSVLRFKTDNCSAQYKCRYVFNFWRDLAVTTKKIIITYFGVPGHGKGLVDAMSSFGVKTPIKNHILRNDVFF